MSKTWWQRLYSPVAMLLVLLLLLETPLFVLAPVRLAAASLPAATKALTPLAAATMFGPPSPVFSTLNTGVAAGKLLGQEHPDEDIYAAHLPLMFKEWIPPAPPEAWIVPGEGGEIGSPDGKVRVYFGPDSVTQTVIARYQAGVAPSLPEENRGVAGPAFVLSAQALDGRPVDVFPPLVQVITSSSPFTDGGILYDYIVTPTVQVVIRYSYADAWGLDERSLALYTRESPGDPWSPLPTVVDIVGNQARIGLEHLSEFVLMAPLSIQSGERVALDADHGGADPGGWVDYPPNFAAVEKTYTLEIARMVRDRLQDRCSIIVGMVRDADVTVPHRDRPGIIMGFDPDLAVTVAFNTSGLGYMWYGPGGTMGLVDFRKPPDMAFATAMNARIAEHTGVPNHRGIRDARYWRGGIYVPTHLPNILYDQAEIMFLDNYHDRAVMDDPVGKGAIADAIYNEIITQLGLAGGQCELLPPPSPEQIQRWRDLGYQNYLRYGGDPVSLSTGNHVVQVHLFRIPGRGSLNWDFTLTYNSQDGRDGTLGYGWSMPYDMRTTLYRDGSVDVRYADGRTYHYTWNGSGYDAPAGVHDVLAQTSGGWELTTPVGTVYTFEQASRGGGRLTGIHDRVGNSLAFSYNGNGDMTGISDGAGRNVTLSYTDGHVTRIDDFAGRHCMLGYTNGDLTAITDANGGTRRFQYDSRHRQTHAWDEENILYLQSIYDDRDRVVEQVDASGAHCYFAYDVANRRTIFTDNMGKQQVYYWDALNRVTSEQDANGSRVQSEYDADYNLTAHTDANGNTTRYEYDDRGNVLARHDPIPASVAYTGDTTRWAYDERNHVISKTDALSHTWLYEYDAQGNLVHTIAPSNTETWAEYDVWGQPTAITDANGHTTRYEYDAAGNLVRTIYPDGSSASSTYDAAGREVSYTDANGHTVTFQYDGNGNITHILDPKGIPSTFEYDGNDLLVRSVDRRGGEWLYQYDDDLKLTAERDPEGNWTRYSYDALYRQVAVTDALGYVTRYVYDDAGRLISSTDPTGAVTRYEYDAEGNQTAVVDALGGRSRKVYDAVNRLKYEVDALGHVTEYCYDAEDRLIRTIGPRGEVTDYTYDALGRLVAVKDPLGNVTRYEYDGVGNRTAMIDPLGNRTDYTYDTRNRNTTILNPVLPGGLRPTTRYRYDAVGNTLAITTPRGFVSTLSYDENDQQVLATDPLGGQVRRVYDPEGNPVVTIDPNGHAITTTYNLVGLPVCVTDTLGYATTIEYDALYRRVRQVDPLGFATTYIYDPLGRLVQEIDPLGNASVRNEYDALGRVVATYDANGNVTRYGYDPLGRLITVTDALSGTTQYGYDEVGNLVVITDANGYATHFEYSFLNRLKREINPLENVWEYSYDGAGRMVRRVDAMAHTTYYDYDSNGRLTAIRYGVTPPTLPPITFTYDLDGNQLQMCDGLGCTVSVYDPLGRRVATTDWLGRTIGRAYDAAGNLVTMTYPNGYQAGYAYNANNALAAFTDPHGDASIFTYDGRGYVTGVQHPNGTIATFTRDAAGRLTAIDNRRVGADRSQSAYAYMLDAAGNRVQVREERAAFDGSDANVVLAHQYEYDPLNRLARAVTVDPASDTAYAFDPVGNRLRKEGTVLAPDPSVPQLPVVPRPEVITYTYNAANQLLAANDTAFAYNPNGDRIQEVEVLTVGLALVTGYTYDREDRLVGVSKALSDGVSLTVTMVATYTYDGYGRRAVKEVAYPGGITATQVITYLYDGLDIVGARLAVSGTVTETYYYLAPSPVTGLRRPLEMERLPNPATGFPGDRYWYQTDGLDSVVTLSDEGGDLMSPYLYEEYGGVVVGMHDLQVFTYVSQDYDLETGLYHFHARYYDAELGAWLTVDDAGTPQVSLYTYANENPTTYFDVLGYLSFEDIWNIIKFTTGIAQAYALEQLYWKVAEAFRQVGLPNSANLLGYYLGGSGRERTVSWDYVRDCAAARGSQKNFRKKAQQVFDLLEGLHLSRSFPEPVYLGRASMSATIWEPDAYVGLRKFDMTAVLKYKVTWLSDRHYRARGTVRYDMDDVYNFSGREAADILNKVGMQDLGEILDAIANPYVIAHYGLAREFPVVSSYEEYVDEYVGIGDRPKTWFEKVEEALEKFMEAIRAIVGSTKHRHRDK